MKFKVEYEEVEDMKTRKTHAQDSMEMLGPGCKVGILVGDVIEVRAEGAEDFNVVVEAKSGAYGNDEKLELGRPVRGGFESTVESEVGTVRIAGQSENTDCSTSTLRYREKTSTDIPQLVEHNLLEGETDVNGSCQEKGERKPLRILFATE